MDIIIVTAMHCVTVSIMLAVPDYLIFKLYDIVLS